MDDPSFVVVTSTVSDKYERIGTVAAFRVPGTGAAAPTVQLLANDLGEPSSFEGGCEAGTCVVALHDYSDNMALRLSFDASGPIWSPTPIEGGTGFYPEDAVRDGDFTLVSAVVYPSEAELVWLPDDPSASPERLAVPYPWFTGISGSSGMAIADDGVVLRVWLELDRAAGDPAPGPPEFVRFVAQRAQRGVGLLDPTPIDLGGGSRLSSIDVAFTGASFVVAIHDPDSDPQQLIRIGTDGVVSDPVEVPDPDPAAQRVNLVAGAPGHLLWTRRICAAYDPLIPEACDEYAHSYQIVEIDVPEGGACSDAAACISGFCSAGVCTSGPAAGDTGSVETRTSADKGCGCGSPPGAAPGAGLLAMLVGALVGRRRR